MLSNFDFLDIRPEDSGSFIPGSVVREKSAVFLSYEKRVPYFLSYEKRVSLDFTHVNIPVR